MASLITNVFEDSDANFAFASCSDIGDKRGYTAGYAGFTTGTGDAETLIKDYNNISPGNSLEHYTSQLATLSALPHCDRDSRGSTAGLDGYCDAWKSEACNTNHQFSDLQREWVYQNYMLPSARYAAQSGVHSELGKAIFYDTIIQHGYQYVEPDINIVRIINLTGPRKANESEQDYLTRFLTTRREFQCCYPDTVWPASGTRSADLLTLVSNFDENKDLHPPIELQFFERTITGNEDMTKDVKRC
ncbi:glycoside hydrolase family 46 protein [Backusella circina FSU 941]|nr:glycoside hydrolase family 46 protein [Backusella circina FSU 941]